MAWGSFACNGGYVDYGFSYAAVYPIMQESNYRYRERDGEDCKFDVSKGLVQVDDNWTIPRNDIDQLKAALMLGPVGVAVDSSSTIFRNYRKGVIKSQNCGLNLGHAVLAVGYGTDEEGDDYVMIKNSWGRSWGDNGVGKIQLAKKYSR